MDVKKHMKHIGLMILGYLLSLILVIMAIKYLGGDKIFIGNYSFLFIFLCPLVHVLMMIFIFKGRGENCHRHLDENKKY